MRDDGSGRWSWNEKMLSTTSKSHAEILTGRELASFQRRVWRFYRRHGRHDLPWRHTQDPYLIWVSELMLQQTQVSRVRPKYEVFVARFPTVEALATASLGEVLRLWQGLGYNRRAKYLHEAACIIQQQGGLLPTTYEAWQTLPGVGDYTATAIMVFAYDAPLPLIETNIRTVFLHEFFPTEVRVNDARVWPYIEASVPRRRAREWFYALMDYGAHLKVAHGNPSRRSTTHKRQAPFLGSSRQIRGTIIRLLAAQPSSQSYLTRQLSEFDPLGVAEQIERLVNEGLVVKEGRKYALPT